MRGPDYSDKAHALCTLSQEDKEVPEYSDILIIIERV